jgi:hypothetical protein
MGAYHQSWYFNMHGKAGNKVNTLILIKNEDTDK